MREECVESREVSCQARDAREGVEEGNGGWGCGRGRGGVEGEGAEDGAFEEAVDVLDCGCYGGRGGGGGVVFC